MKSLILIAHNLRSSHNVGSLLRTADGFAVDKVYLTGYTPYPISKADTRLPHIARKVNDQIAKTALGAEKYVKWQHSSDVFNVLRELKDAGYVIAGLEQGPQALPLHTYGPPSRLAVLVGREVEGIEPDLIEHCDTVLEIPMLGNKESFNVVQAAAIALYHCRFKT